MATIKIATFTGQQSKKGKKPPQGMETLPPWLWPNYTQTSSPTSIPTTGSPATFNPSSPATAVAMSAPTAPRPVSPVALAKLDPFYAASNRQAPTLLQTPAVTGSAPIYSSGGSAPGQAASTSTDRGAIPWAGTPEGQAAQVARWQQAVSGYTNSAGTPIPGIPGMSFLDWYYQLGGRIQSGMSQGEANYIAAREAPYARLRQRINRYSRSSGGGGGGGVTTPASETVEGDSLRYNPAPTNWRIG